MVCPRFGIYRVSTVDHRPPATGLKSLLPSRDVFAATECREKTGRGWGAGCSQPVAPPRRGSEEDAAAVGISGTAEEGERHPYQVSLSHSDSTVASAAAPVCPET